MGRLDVASNAGSFTGGQANANREFEPATRGTGTSQVTWQFLLEPLRGYLMLAERLADNGSKFASGWNFGPADADAKPVSWIADEVVRLWGAGASCVS